MQRRSIRPCSGNSRGDLIWLRAMRRTDRSMCPTCWMHAAFIVTAQDFDDQRKERTIGTTDTKNDDRKNTDKKQHTYIEKECKLASCFVN